MGEKYGNSEKWRGRKERKNKNMPKKRKTSEKQKKEIKIAKDRKWKVWQGKIKEWEVKNHDKINQKLNDKRKEKKL